MYQSPGCTPSGIRSRPAAVAVVTRSTPSAPTPRRRSHSAATTAGVNGNWPSGSGSSTKSFCVPWPLANFTCSGYVPPYPQRVLDVAGVAAVEPADAVVAAEPRSLAADVAPGAEERGLAGARSVAALVEVGDHLGVAQGPRRGDALAQPVFQQRLNLADEPVGEHLVRPPRQPLVEKCCVPIQSDNRRVPPRRADQGRRSREGLSGEFDDLQCPHDAAAVGRQDRGGGLGVDPCQFFVQSAGTDLG